MTSRSTLTTQINNLDLGDHTSHLYFRKYLLQLIEMGDVGFGGSKFYLDPVNGSDTNDGTGPDDAVKTLAVAYALLTANKNDMLYLIGGASSITIPSGFTWAKDYTHFIGLASAIRHGGRARLGHSADFTPIFPITASGCQFSNLHIQHGRGNAANLVNVYITGSRNSFYNVHFEGPLHATEAGAAFRQLSLGNGAQANNFVGCSIGGWTIQQTVATGREIEFLGDNGDTYFENCIIRSYANNIAHAQVGAGVNLGGEASLIEFESCKFLQLDDDKVLTQAIVTPTTGNIILSNCKGIRVADWSSGAKVTPVDSSLALN